MKRKRHTFFWEKKKTTKKRLRRGKSTEEFTLRNYGSYIATLLSRTTSVLLREFRSNASNLLDLHCMPTETYVLPYNEDDVTWPLCIIYCYWCAKWNLITRPQSMWRTIRESIIMVEGREPTHTQKESSTRMTFVSNIKKRTVHLFAPLTIADNSFINTLTRTRREKRLFGAHHESLDMRASAVYPIYKWLRRWDFSLGLHWHLHRYQCAGMSR